MEDTLNHLVAEWLHFNFFEDNIILSKAERVLSFGLTNSETQIISEILFTLKPKPWYDLQLYFSIKRFWKVWATLKAGGLKKSSISSGHSLGFRVSFINAPYIKH